MDLARKLKIRSLVNVASEGIPYCWPMRSFIYRNPLHNLEKIPFKEAVEIGRTTFKAKGYLSRGEYQKIYREKKIKKEKLIEAVEEFLKRQTKKSSLDLDFKNLVFNLLTQTPELKPYENLHKIYPCSASKELLDSLTREFYENPKEACAELLLSVGYKNTLYEAVDELIGSSLKDTIDELTIKSVEDFLDEGQSNVEMPKRELGFFKSWKELASRNLRFSIATGKNLKKLVSQFEEPEEALDFVLNTWELPESIWDSCLTLELSQLKGFAGYIKWRMNNKNFHWQREYPVDMVEYAAVRLTIAKALLDAQKHLPFKPTYKGLEEFLTQNPEKAYLMHEYFSSKAESSFIQHLPDCFKKPERIIKKYLHLKSYTKAVNTLIFLEQWLNMIGISLKNLSLEHILELLSFYKNLEKEEGHLWLRALEESVYEELLTKLKFSSNHRSNEKKISAQALFCIDARSERFRRNLEGLGRYETYGTAGFFGIPMAFVELTKGHEEYLCPVLIKPSNVVLELPVSDDESHLKAHHIVEEVIHDLKFNVLTPYVMVEAIGFLFGFDFIGKTFLPREYSRIKDKILNSSRETSLLTDKFTDEEIENIIGSKPLDKLTLSHIRDRFKRIGFSYKEQALLAAVALQMIGLTQNFANLILIIGHESQSDNNLYESSLDCGACGGASGVYNAKVFCQMANNPQVRSILKVTHEINIPEDTVFVPAVHNTTTDKIALYELGKVSAKYTQTLKNLKEDLEIAARLTREKRGVELGINPDHASEEIYQNAYDWSQIRPEWGLSGNYAFVIAKRDITLEIDLKGKVFLHSYDWKQDKSGFLLENILSGPMVVAQWINMEYYFSTTDNEGYGSGSKIYHNAVGTFGIMTGNFSDLKTGLPAQTVLKGDIPFHNPVRLLVVVQAPVDFAAAILNKLTKIKKLAQNQWIHLIILDEQKQNLYRYQNKDWQEINPKGEIYEKSLST
jgi:uncharacterized protein YbcC (UPF0753/DUF2309 family)